MVHGWTKNGCIVRKKGVQIGVKLIITVVACSRRSDNVERCEVKEAIPLLLPRFNFSRSFLLRTAPHYLNAWNRLSPLEQLGGITTEYAARRKMESVICEEEEYRVKEYEKMSVRLIIDT